MRVVVNERLVKRRAETAQRAMTIGMMMLLIALVLSFNLRYIWLAYLLMLAGVVLLNWGVSSGNKWLRKPRIDQELAKALKGLDHGHRLYNYLLPAEHVLLSPAGLFVLKVKQQDGKISCRGEKWRRQFSLRRLLRALIEPPLGNPSKQARLETDKLRRFMTKHLPGVDVPMQPVVVFINPKADLDVVEPVLPAMSLNALKAYLRSATQERMAPQETLQALANLFDEQAT